MANGKYRELAARGQGTEPSLSDFVEDGGGGYVLKTLDTRMSLFYHVLRNLPLSYQGV